MALCAQVPTTETMFGGALDAYRSATERRRDGRAEFDYRLSLTPLDEGAEREAVVVFGRDLGATGIGFRHAAPLPFRRVLLEGADPRLEAIGLADLRVEVVLRWCRFLSEGRYESGGRIARSPLTSV